jgi:hypothetical protein
MNDEKSRQAILERAVKTWGVQIQLVIALEEFAELSKEVAKTLRKKKLSENLADEIADAEIMLTQLRIVAHEMGDGALETLVEERKAFKIERLRTRLDDWERDHK